MPRDRIGIALGRNPRGTYVGVVVMCTIAMGTNTMRHFAYQVGKAIGTILSEEEQENLAMHFKGRNTSILTERGLDKIYRGFAGVDMRPSQRRYYNWTDLPSTATNMGYFIQEYMDRERVQERTERDPSLPDNVWESDRVPI